MKHILSILSLFLCLLIYCSDNNWTYCTKDLNGDFFVAGIVQDYGSPTIHVIKSDSTGNVIWQFNIGGPDADIIRAVETDGSNFFIAGNTNNYGFGSPGDAFLIKLDNNGNILFDQVYSELNKVEFNDLYFSNNSLFGAGSTNSFSNDLNFFVSEINTSNGSLISSTLFEDQYSSAEEAIQISGSSTGDLYIMSTNSSAAIITRFDAASNLVYSKSYSGLNTINPSYFSVNDNNEVYITGLVSLTMNNAEHLFILKTDNNGALIASNYYDWNADSKGLRLELFINEIICSGFYYQDPGATILNLIRTDTDLNLNNAFYLDLPNHDITRNRFLSKSIDDHYHLYNVVVQVGNSVSQWDVSKSYFKEDNLACFNNDSLPVQNSFLLNSKDYVFYPSSISFYNNSGFQTSTAPAPIINRCDPVIVLFTTEQDGLCAGEISFINESINANTFIWDFGDGNTSSDTNPMHTYETNGNYTVSLTVDDGMGNNIVSEVDVTISNIPTLEIIGLPAVTNSIVPIGITTAPAGGVLEGNGIVFNAFNPTLAGPGIHTVTYTYTDSNNCVYATEESVLVVAISYSFVEYNLGVISP